jgi:hypothetical protein
VESKERGVVVLNDGVEPNVVEEEVVREGCLVLEDWIPSNSSIHTQKRKKLSTESDLNASW